ncbi:MAG: hypothetical protein KatS3mg112_1024 [Thermogutta sp.]|nr:MAG: hypothetical protein KatS3mg112_1024 [Thermogutta sp.]
MPEVETFLGPVDTETATSWVDVERNSEHE